jgi:hypothetical protein
MICKKNCMSALIDQSGLWYVWKTKGLEGDEVIQDWFERKFIVIGSVQ